MSMIIDFVLPWVDNQDLEWQKSRQQYAEKSVVIRCKFECEISWFRYIEICTSFNWKKLSLVWIKIYLVTCGHHPEWLDINSPKIELIKHSDIYDNKEHLPVFNSSSIEMSLPNIEGLSEHFVYLNDDTI